MTKNKNIIGIDVDCVLTELGPTIEHMAKIFDKPVAKIEDVEDYNLSTVYDVSMGETMNFWVEEEYYLCKSATPSSERIESIYSSFVDDEAFVIIITSRHKMYYEQTLEWLNRNNIEFDMLIHTDGKSKKPFIEYFEIDYMIDDKPDLFYEMDGSDTTMVCVDYNYNLDAPSELRMSLNGELYSGETN